MISVNSAMATAQLSHGDQKDSDGCLGQSAIWSHDLEKGLVGSLEYEPPKPGQLLFAWPGGLASALPLDPSAPAQSLVGSRCSISLGNKKTPITSLEDTVLVPANGWWAIYSRTG